MSQIGTPLDKVTLKIGYNIIKHFSEHLYKSPNKAIEELVVNGYDAGASWVRVWLNGDYGDDCVVVWDNGDSMDVEGLQNLWGIADSPKHDEATRTIVRDGVTRKIIGKFGIGKLASYSLGNKITHLCNKEGSFLMVTVDFEQLLDPSRKVKTDSGEEVKPVTADIYQLDTESARDWLESKFKNIPPSFEQCFQEKNWTVAIADKMKPFKTTPGRLRWILGASMPLSVKFNLWVDEAEVQPNLKKAGVLVDWDFGAPEIEQALKNNWNSEKKKNSIFEGDLEFGKKVGLQVDNPEQETPYVKFPNLGLVRGHLRLYDKSLKTVQAEEDGDYFGFFVFVRERLLNTDDKKLFLNDPSFQTFYSAQFILHCDELDKHLSADREGLSGDSLSIKELEFLQRTVYNTIKNKQQKIIDGKKSLPVLKYPLDSPELYLTPLAALYSLSGEDVQMSFEPENPAVTHENLGEREPYCQIDFNKGIVYNADHALRRTIEKNHGKGKAQAILSEIDRIALSDVLLSGYLYEIGVADELRTKVVEWKDNFYRKIATLERADMENIALSLRNSSYKSGEPFENAIANAFGFMGFDVEVDGKPNKKDGLIKAMCGDESYVLTYEAKAKKSEGCIGNDDAEVAVANAHRKEEGAEHAVIVARCFGGLKNLTETAPAILRDCRAVDNRVSILEVDQLIQLMTAVRTFHYSLIAIKPVLTTVELPSEKTERINALNQPENSFDFRDLLEKIRNEQKEIGQGQLVAIHTIWQRHYRATIPEFEKFIPKIEALWALAYPYVKYETNNKLVGLTTIPDVIMDRVTSRLLDR